ncbi:hypothetical protein [uncultured Polaribacter sp.]|uniref:hypothetical protein n=1 Tax=uncultured Polaribacter sp. TaxID=174711 RepID=UPI0030D8512E|tara:strand:+ start:21005 stop:21331 length:327 start_codon:yes stop_codon:yes gene_type:complete
MIIEKKENYTLISSDENSFSEFILSFLKREKEFKKVHLVLLISDEINIKKEEFSLFLKSFKKKKNTSFVIVSNNVNSDDVPENFNIVPTLTEAEDIIEMEAIERELGF